MKQKNPWRISEAEDGRLGGLVSFLCSALAVLAAALSTWAAPAVDSPASAIVLRDGWRLQTTVLTTENGETVSRPGFKTDGWYAAAVPTTVLTALVRNSVYPDPYVGTNNLRIPDASDEYNREWDLAKFSHLPGGRNPWSDPWWFRTTFKLPAEFRDKHLRLTIEGINYRAEIWLNGRKLAGANEVVGMFGRWPFDVTGIASPDADNVLAVKVFPLDFPGLPTGPQLKTFGPFGDNAGPTGDIGKNVTMHCSVGWDWMPAIRDRNMGIWQDVELSASGPVDIRDVQIVTDLPLPAVSSADMRVRADVANLGDAALDGILTLRVLSPKPARTEVVRVSEKVALTPRGTSKIDLAPDIHPELRIKAPTLWWPNGMGRPDLYELALDFEVGGVLSKSERIPFGIREVSSRDEKVDGWDRREFLVNGVKVPIRGAAWVPDMMLNHSAERLRSELRLWKEANLNIVRIWGGGTTPREEFFDACDELGLFVWHDFWITGDCEGTWDRGSPDYPFDARAFLKNAVDVVKKIRNHPSLLVWTAGNEGYPREEIYRPLRDEIVAGLDGTRPFIPSSGYRTPPAEWGLSWPDDKGAGTYSGGPYNWVDPKEYDRLVRGGKDWLFKNEVGLPSVPVLESLKEFVPVEPDPAVKFPLNNVWGYHDACEDNGKYSHYDEAIRTRYGEPKNLADYVLKAQLVNAESYRAIFEAVNRAGDKTSGVILWKGNPAWPSVIWQIYDWYLRPHAGYYFMKKACEPLHIQLDPSDGRVHVVNSGLEARKGLTAKVFVYDRNFKPVREWSTPLDVPGASVKEVVPPAPGPENLPAGGTGFTALRLSEKETLVSDNFYWLSPDGKFDCLAALAPARLEVSAKRHLVAGRPRVRVRLKNGGSGLAFFIAFRMENESGKDLLPSLWSDDYMTLLPGESKDITWTSVDGAASAGPLKLKVECWNTPAQVVVVR